MATFESMADGMDVKGKVVVCTGGGSGMGREMCIEAAKRGASAVVPVDFNLKGAEETVARIKQYAKCNAVAMYADCGKEVDMFNIITKVENEIGPIALFIANAGIAAGGQGVLASDKDWDMQMGVNFKQHMYWARYLLPRMVKRGGGYIIVTSSAAGLLYVPQLIYKVSKAAALALAEWVAVTHREDGIGCTVLCPQAVCTNLFATSLAFSRDTVVKDTKSDNVAQLSDTDANTGAAGGDGILEADDVARLTLNCAKNGTFLALPHKEVATYIIRKSQDTTRWIKGASRSLARFAQDARNEVRQPSKL